MASGTSVDPESVLRTAFPQHLKLDPDARHRLDELIRNGAKVLVGDPSRVSEAQESMQKLALYLERERSFARSTPITASGSDPTILTVLFPHSYAATLKHRGQTPQS
jgi:hypothetical protein